MKNATKVNKHCWYELQCRVKECGKWSSWYVLGRHKTPDGAWDQRAETNAINRQEIKSGNYETRVMRFEAKSVEVLQGEK